MVGMTIPSFPSQDLAKLVLGYLAEEQLMTAYDEFLQASPYLDALQNEYDRIFMTSLKNILAEYRAVKIYVETCKPFALRKKLCQCTNLLEVVKYLINHIDINKIINQDNNATKFSSEKLHSTTVTNTATKADCEVCSSLKILECVCKPKQTEVNTSGTQPISNVISCQEVETTPLSDLPGNHVTTRKKHVKVLEKDASTSLFNSSCEQQETSSNNSTCAVKNMSTSSSNSCTMSTTIENPNMTIKPTESLESQQKIQEFNDVLKLVCNKNTNNSNIQQDYKGRRASTAGTFQDFSTGVTGSDTSNVIVPDSSTCENINVKNPLTKEATPSIDAGSNKVTRGQKTQYLLKVANDNDNSDSSSHISDVIDVESLNDSTLPRIKPKENKSKVTILSDIKVDNEALASNLKMPAVLKNATSTPITKMQTILINGTPVYRPVQHLMSSSTYTTDEIMAMPTIIITPVSGPVPLLTTHRTLYTSSQNTTQNTNAAPVIADVTPKSLEPLIIDVSSSITLPTEKLNLPSQSQHETCNEARLVKTVDNANLDKAINLKNDETVTSASVPKDNVVPGCAVTSTPQVVPPTRKSSSTPRRTSHVRVLDFATPRRILHERIDECVVQDTVAEVVVSKSSTNVIQNVATLVNTTGVKNESLTVTTSTNKSKIVVKRSKNWDADLRALISGVQEDTRDVSLKSQSKCKQKSTKKKKESSSQHHNDKKTSVKKKQKSKKKKSRSPEKPIEDMNSVHEPVDSQNKEVTIIKPTINIVSRNENDKCNQETKKAQNKSNSEEHDTPEGDRMSLPNVIGARLNISDLLETPYKQALYDIQMETPKFLGDLPDDPMSDIKIMNIPTPLFLNSSKGTQATPSSYCSRPTDYSSGGSYYKPDDQDYLPLPEHLDCPEKLSKETQNVESRIDNENETVDNNENSNRLRPSRPVRQCTKNVSYYNNLNLHIKDKTKDIDESFEDNSSFCDSVSSLSEKKTNKENISKVHKENTPKTKPKIDKGKKINSKKYKSPVKKDSSKSFMKIRPRRSTPIKCVKNEKTKRKSSEFSLSLKSRSPRKRTTSKDRNIHSTPAVTVVPTKSRRKSSTPRKLHCTKTFNSESSGHNSPDIASKDKANAPQESHLLCVLDSDTEQLPLRWSDDGSQDAKCKEQQEITANESEDITKIQEYIKTTVSNTITHNESEGSLHIDLVKRGFDVETAKIIERDLLDTPPYPKQDSMFISKPVETLETKKDDTVMNKTVESENSFSNNLQIVQDEPEPDEDEVEFGDFECNEESTNYFTCQHDETKVPQEVELVKLKDKFCMEVCIEDDVTVRLRATPFNLTLDVQPQNEDVIEYNQKEIEAAVRTISEINTPLKDSIKAQCFEIFDSTLTSLDTPLKATSPKKKEQTVTYTEIVLEVEKLDVKEKSDSKKRKRIRSGNTSDESTDSKKVKPDAQYLFNSANIQNIDIESVLSKLHGP